LVADVDAAVAFYVDMLGFELMERWGAPFAMVKRGAWNLLVLETDDLVSLVAKLTSSGAHFRSRIVSGPGGKQILVNDPAGNRSGPET